MTKDADDFSAEMEKNGVLPLPKRQGKVATRVPVRDVNIVSRRQAATSDFLQDNDPQHYEAVEWLGPHDLVEYRRPGLQHESFKKLKQGRYDVSADLDLHGYRIDEAKTVLFQFIKNCQAQDVRCAIIVHGKGWHSIAAPAMDQYHEDSSKAVSRLKSYVVHWLKSAHEVQACSSAQPRDGGTGALYVLFKKSDKVRERGRYFYPDEN